jgi:hypothetical protein
VLIRVQFFHWYKQTDSHLEISLEEIKNLNKHFRLLF